MDPGFEEDDFPEPDPVDSLLAIKEKGKPDRPMDFVRLRFKKLKEENKDLKNQVADLKHTLAIVQTAQQWSQGNLMSQEQAQKVKEMTMLLQQAKAARDDAANFSKVGKAAMYEKVRQYKNALKKEREEKRVIKEENKKLAEKQKREREGWQEFVREMKDRHRKEMAKLQGDLEGHDEKRDERQKQLSHFGERVMQELSSLQQHLQEVRQETVDNVVLEGDEEFEERILGPRAGIHGTWSEDEANL